MREERVTKGPRAATGRSRLRDADSHSAADSKSAQTRSDQLRGGGPQPPMRSGQARRRADWEAKQARRSHPAPSRQNDATPQSADSDGAKPGYIDNWRPNKMNQAHWSRVSAFVRECGHAAAANGVTVRRKMSFLAEFADWCVSKGLELDPTFVLSHDLIHRFVTERIGDLALTSRRTASSALISIAEGVQRVPMRPISVSGGGSETRRIYSANHFARMLASAEQQPSARRRQDFLWILVGGRAIGFTARELAEARWNRLPPC